MRLIPLVFTYLHALSDMYMSPGPIPTLIIIYFGLLSTINCSKVLPCMCESLGGKQSFVLLDHPFPTPPQVPDRDGPAIVTIP